MLKPYFSVGVKARKVSRDCVGKSIVCWKEEIRSGSLDWLGLLHTPRRSLREALNLASAGGRAGAGGDALARRALAVRAAGPQAVVRSVGACRRQRHLRDVCSAPSDGVCQSAGCTECPDGRSFPAAFDTCQREMIGPGWIMGYDLRWRASFASLTPVYLFTWISGNQLILRRYPLNFSRSRTIEVIQWFDFHWEPVDFCWFVFRM